MRQRLPEIVDPIRLPGGHDVVIHRPDFRGGLPVFDQSKSRHDISLRNTVTARGRPLTRAASRVSNQD